MKRLCLLSLIAIPLLVVRSDEPVPQGFEHWTPATCNALRKHLPRTLPRIRIISP